MKERLIKLFNGYSGCTVCLLSDGKKTFVRKTSANHSYNARLKQQYYKQQAFIPSEFVLTPKILACHESDDLFCFDMEFIDGRTLADWMESISTTEVVNFTRILFHMQDKGRLKCLNEGEKAFRTKILMLEHQLSAHKHLKKAFDKLHKYPWNKVEYSMCHGDLTLENIIVGKDSKLYLIDFLDSFYSSWMIDIAKLLQDILLQWSFRHKERVPNRSLRLQIAKECLTQEILSLPQGKDKLQTIYHILLLNLLRIYPYLKDEKTHIYLDNAIRQLMDFLDTKREVII